MFTSAIPPNGHPRQSGLPQWVSTAVRSATVSIHYSQADHSGRLRQSCWPQWASTAVRLAAVGVHDSKASCSGYP